MEYCIYNNFNFVLTLCLLFTLFIVLPGIYTVLALSASKKWRAFKSKLFLKRSNVPGKKLRRYWEIDVKKLH
jgi:hypothetical protein